MIKYSTTIHKFDKQGEKTGWTYIEIPADIAEKLKPGMKQSFRVKGKLDKVKISGIALLPMGGGSFIMPLNADTRKAIGKGNGAILEVELIEDKQPFQFNKDLMSCLADEPPALKFFESLASSHQRYFSKWIDAAKGDTTRDKRIAQAVVALAKKLGYTEMIRGNRKA